ncbi:hypothetical protein BVY03_00095 [bacterium K02(2017)]|nr:hypothetical protein BVY03_00095 [bacterium K02(2017)]
MFAPYPILGDGWYVIPGKLRDGTTIDLINSEIKNPSWDKVKNAYNLHGNRRMTNFMLRLQDDIYKHLYANYGRYLCRKWNNYQYKPQLELVAFNIYFMSEKTINLIEQPAQRLLKWRHYCFEEKDLLTQDTFDN